VTFSKHREHMLLGRVHRHGFPYGQLFFHALLLPFLSVLLALESDSSAAILKSTKAFCQSESRYARSAATPSGSNSIDVACAHRPVGHEACVNEHSKVLGNRRSSNNGQAFSPNSQRESALFCEAEMLVKV
jgi:hypothetical protein